METLEVPVWFVCRLCNDSFDDVHRFIKHKKGTHFVDFQKTKCIVFEEKTSTSGDPGLADRFAPTDTTDIFAPAVPTVAFKQERCLEPEPRIIEVFKLRSGCETIYDPSVNLPFTSSNNGPIFPVTADSPIHNSTSSHACNDNDVIYRNRNNAFADHDFPHNSATESGSMIDGDVDFDFEPNFIHGNIDNISIHEDEIENEVSLTTEPVEWADDLISEPETKFVLFHNSDQVAPSTLDSKTVIQSPHNPFVLLKRLTAKQIQRACHPHSSDDVEESAEDVEDAEDSVEESELSAKQTSHETFSVYTVPIYQCRLCSKSFRYEARFNVHASICSMYNSNKEQRQLNSNINALKFVGTRRIHVPSSAIDSERRFKCDLCLKTFKRKCHLTEHQEFHQNMYQFKCSHEGCTKVFKRSRHLRAHNATHLAQRPSRPYRCVELNCGKTFIRTGDLKFHIQMKHGKKTSQLSYKKTLYKQNKVRQHSTFQHSNFQNLQMQQSEETVNVPVLASQSIAETQRIVTTEVEVGPASQTIYKCPLCPRIFLQQVVMRRHMLVHTKKISHHPDSSRVLETGRKLPQCNFKLLENTEQKHLCTESNCRKEFVSAGGLKRHMMVKHGKVGEEFPVSTCNICNTTMYTKNLRRHISEHTKDRAFHCTVDGCTKAFKRKSDLKVHEERHLARIQKTKNKIIKLNST